MPFKVVLTEANQWTQPQREVQPAHHIVTNRRPQISLEALGYGPVGEKIEADPTMNGLECLLDESLGIGLNHGVEGPGNHRQLGTEAPGVGSLVTDNTPPSLDDGLDWLSSLHFTQAMARR